MRIKDHAHFAVVILLGAVVMLGGCGDEHPTSLPTAVEASMQGPRQAIGSGQLHRRRTATDSHAPVHIGGATVRHQEVEGNIDPAVRGIRELNAPSP